MYKDYHNISYVSKALVLIVGSFGLNLLYSSTSFSIPKSKSIPNPIIVQFLCSLLFLKFLKELSTIKSLIIYFHLYLHFNLVLYKGAPPCSNYWSILTFNYQYVCPYGYSNVSVCGLESYYYYYYRKQLDCGAHC